MVLALVSICRRSARAKTVSALAPSVISWTAFCTMMSAVVLALFKILPESTMALASSVLAMMSFCSLSFLASSMSARAASLPMAQDDQ